MSAKMQRAILGWAIIVVGAVVAYKWWTERQAKKSTPVTIPVPLTPIQQYDASADAAAIAAQAVAVAAGGGLGFGMPQNYLPPASGLIDRM